MHSRISIVKWVLFSSLYCHSIDSKIRKEHALLHTCFDFFGFTSPIWCWPDAHPYQKSIDEWIFDTLSPSPFFSYSWFWDKTEWHVRFFSLIFIDDHIYCIDDLIRGFKKLLRNMESWTWELHQFTLIIIIICQRSFFCGLVSGPSKKQSCVKIRREMH